MRRVSPPMGRVQPPPLLFSCISMQTGRVQSPSPLYSSTYLGTTNVHHPRKRANTLVFGGGCCCPGPLSPTTHENEHTCSFSLAVLLQHHQFPPPSKTSTHLLVFAVVDSCSPGPPLSPTTHENEHTCSCSLVVVV